MFLSEALPIPAGHFVLEALDPRTRRRLLAASTCRRFPPGCFLFAAGSEAESLMVVERGVVKLTGGTARGREAILSLALPGDIPGLPAVVARHSHRLDAVALTGVRVRAFAPTRFLQAAVVHPSAARRILEVMAAEVHASTASVLELTTVDVAGRLAARLLELASVLGVSDGDGIEIFMPVNQEELGRMAAASRERTCRTLRALRAEGVLDYDGPRLRIHKPDVLDRLRCGGRAAALSPSASEAVRSRSRRTSDT